MTKKISKKPFLNRRKFLRRMANSSLGIYLTPAFLISVLAPLKTLIAQEGIPMPPSFGTTTSSGKVVSEKEIRNSSEQLAIKWLINTPSNSNKKTTNRELIQQQNEIETALKTLIKEKGYELQAPQNLRIVD